MAQWRITAADGRTFTVTAATDLAARYFAEQKGIVVTRVDPLDEEAAQVAPPPTPSGAPRVPAYAPPPPRPSGDMAETLRSLDARVATITETLHRNSWISDRRLYFSTTRNAVMWGVVLAWLFISLSLALIAIVLMLLGMFAALGR